MSNPIGPGDPTEPHGIPAVNPPPVDPRLPSSHRSIRHKRYRLPPAPTPPPVDTHLQAATHLATTRPFRVGRNPGGPYDPYGDEPKKSITGWVIGGIALAALLGLVGGAVWAANANKTPTPTPTTQQYECIADDEFSLANSINIDPDRHPQVDANADRDKDNSQPDGLCDQVGGAGARVIRGADW